MDNRSLQEVWFPDGLCFGCGPANQQGLGLRSFASGETVVAEWHSAEVYRSGIAVVAGGVVGTLLDCHTGAAVLKTVGVRDGRTPYVDGDPWVTKSYTVEFQRPTPLNRQLQLVAEVSDLSDDRAQVHGSIVVDGEITATATADWRLLKPRA